MGIGPSHQQSPFNIRQHFFWCLQVNLANDHRYMPQIVSSAIVNAPPPEGVIKTLHLCSQAHKNVDKSTKVSTPITIYYCVTIVLFCNYSKTRYIFLDSSTILLPYNCTV